MPTGRFPIGFGYLLPDSFQLGGANLLRIMRQPAFLPADEILHIILREYQYGQRAAEIAARGGTSLVDSHAVNDQLLSTNTQNSQSLVGPLELPLSDNPWAEEVTNLVAAGATAAGEEHGPNRAAVIRAKLVKALIGAVVSLIVLPGIILGVLMKQTIAGIALSSAITALANLFAGLYYYLNKRD